MMNEEMKTGSPQRLRGAQRGKGKKCTMHNLRQVGVVEGAKFKVECSELIYVSS